LAPASNAAYVSVSSPKATAGASGVRAACAANSPCTHSPAGQSRAVSFHSSSTRRRSSGASGDTEASGRSGSAANASSSAASCPGIVSANARSKRAASNIRLSSTPSRGTNSAMRP
jgi:hypothetical protein